MRNSWVDSSPRAAATSSGEGSTTPSASNRAPSSLRVHAEPSHTSKVSVRQNDAIGERTVITTSSLSRGRAVMSRRSVATRALSWRASSRSSASPTRAPTGKAWAVRGPINSAAAPTSATAATTSDAGTRAAPVARSACGTLASGAGTSAARSAMPGS